MTKNAAAPTHFAEITSMIVQGQARAPPVHDGYHQEPKTPSQEGDSQMSVRMVRAKIKADKAAELEKAAKEMFTAIEAAQPQGVRYASCKLPDGVTYVILLGLDDDENNPLSSVPAFRDFQENLKTWIAEPPVVEELTPVGSYRLF
jgi:hypothetical protein